jgi:outer membrane receptor protein involved in Fe transport
MVDLAVVSLRRPRRRSSGLRKLGIGAVMTRRDILFCAVAILLSMLVRVPGAVATVLGDVRIVVLDPQKQVVKGAKVTLRAQHSDFSKTDVTNDIGEVFIRSIPVGDYTVTVEAKGFAGDQQAVTVVSGNVSVLQFALTISTVAEQLNVVGNPAIVSSDSATPTTLVNRIDIAETPGADKSNSLAMVTDYVPGAYMAHDQLHIRGGHQVSWLIDGVPVANTNIASNIGPQLDPKDIDYLEAQRGSYAADYGDRTYGVFNIVPRTGFERDNEGELVLSFGNYNQTNDQVSFGGHSQHFAYYTSMNGNQSEYGLMAPVAQVIHDQDYGLGGFASLIYLPGNRDEFRLIASARADDYQVPNVPSDQAADVRDNEVERDQFTIFSWIRTLSPSLQLTVSPFYHFNEANYLGGATDPLISTEKRSSQYAGAQIVLGDTTKVNSVRGGLYGFFQHDSDFFGIQGQGLSVAQAVTVNGNLSAAFVDDQYRPTKWLTLTGGVRLTHFDGTLSENAADPRAGVAFRIPRVNFILRAFYGRYYQAPPLATVSGPLVEAALTQGLGFLPLKGERDEEYQFGGTLPIRGWAVDADYFHTRAANFFDHNNIGNSNVFFPITITSAYIRGIEATMRSPRLGKRVQLFLTYSRQRAEGVGNITGGLTDFSPGTGAYYLDHDQRHTLNAGFNTTLPQHTFLASVVHYGSGFTDGDGLIGAGNSGPEHLPGHIIFDLSGGKSFGENWSVAVHSTNTADKRWLLDNSLTFGGTHFVDPRQVYVELRYRFHY